MRTTQFFLPTLKEVPADAEIISHQLMLRAGMIRKLSAGLYTWLPLGFRVLNKVIKVVREEMDRAGALEVLMPAVQPAELWQETERWDKFGPQLLKMRDRHERSFCFGPTHEEVITDLARRELQSYKQLPINFYQIQVKFRDEIRPRFGVMRAREFIMKDAYSFHLDKTSLAQTYQSMYAAYSRIFTRLGLKFRAVLADTGSIGGSASHEFHVLAASGEDEIAFSDHSDYAANVELAEALPAVQERPVPSAAMQQLDTPGHYTIAEVATFLSLPAQQMVKTLLVKGEDHPVIALVLRGDHELNPIKAEKLAGVAAPLTFASAEAVQAAVGCAPGSIGPVGLTIPMIVDRSAAVLADFACGANQNDKHLINVNWERDVALPQVADLRKVLAGDASPDGQGKLNICRGIEVGHIFQLGDKYSQAMQATITAENGQAVAMAMGCYGIGVSRIVAAAIEQHYDQNGIIWPASMAPFQIALVPINFHRSQQVREFTESLYQQLLAAGYEVLLDDREERAGAMFADMDLIGLPHRLVVSEKGLAAQTIEYKARQSGETRQIPIAEWAVFLQKLT